MHQGIQAAFKDDALREWGCYFFCLMRWGELLTKSSYSDDDIINYFNECKIKGVVEDDCFVINPVAVLNGLLDYPQFKSVAKTFVEPKQDIFVVYQKKPGYGHFTLSEYGYTWDSLLPNRHTADGFVVDSYRVIT